MITNHYLFSSQFRSYLHAQELDDLAFFEGFVATVRSFLHAAATVDLDTLTQRVITPILSQLQFANPPLKTVPTAPAARYAYLYDGFPLTNRVSCVYVVSPAESSRMLKHPHSGLQPASALSLGIDAQGLDVAEKGNFPAFDLIQLLRQANLEWGLLTNGLVWRLYSTRVPQPYEQYLEIDFTDAQEEDFKIFWQLFSLALFLPDEQEVTPLETYIAESQQEAAIIEKHIKSNIEALLENICVGLLTYAGKEQQPLTAEEQQSYFENAVYLLFRLLFVLYAESRELLPVHDPAYQAVSLQSFIRQAHGWKQAGLVNPTGVELWDGFRDLCDKIQFGDPQLDIPEYDGGLFDSREHPFLADPRNKVRNLYFVTVLDLLGYRTVRKDVQPINYRDLSVRSLGSLYEGILEYKLFLAPEELVLRGQTIVPRKDAGKVKKTERVIAPGHVYFAQAANERHDTGSYYTPEEVVNYMVQHSVRVGLEERWTAFQPTVARYEQEVRQAVSEDMRRALRRKFDQEALAFVDTQVLTFTVLDPAMGSGHFLVNALHAITHFILEVVQGGGEPAATSLLTHHNPGIDLTPAVWRRKVVERCIFGVDLNPLAAELAKLSLWIASASAGKPLTFLNHHLKCGDSLIGAQLKEIGRYPLNKKKVKDDGQLGLLERDQGFLATVQDVLQRLENITSQDSESIEQIGAKKQWLKEAQRALEPYKALCDFHTSLFFGNELSHDAYDNVLLSFTPEFNWDGETFFHWELEFPEVLLKGKGFDAVIGNPPYVRQEGLSDIKFHLEKHYHVYSGVADLYVYFFERGLSLLQPGGNFCIIVSNKFLRANYGKSLTAYIQQNYTIKELIDFGDLPIFENAMTYPCIIRICAETPPYDKQVFQYLPLTSCDFKMLQSEIREKGIRVQIKRDDASWILEDPLIHQIFKKVHQQSMTFDKYVEGKIYYGIKTGFNDAFVIDIQTKDNLIEKDSKSSEIIKPYLTGKEINRYSIEWQGNYVILAKNGINIPQEYPAIFEFLSQYQKQLEKRCDQGKYWYNLRACSYYEEFEKSKILWGNLSSRASFAYDQQSFYVNAPACIAPIDSKWILPILNSTVTTFFLKKQAIQRRGGYIEQKPIYVKEIPIPQIPEIEQEAFGEKAEFMLSRHKEFQQRGKDFLKFIESKSNLNKITSRLQKFYTLSFSDILQELEKQDVVILAQDAVTLQTLFNEIQTLHAEIVQTDQEIDRLVYAFYGLTEAEIALVEGRKN